MKIFSLSFDKIFEWFATFVLLLGVVLTSYNMFPATLYVGIFGNILWIFIGIRWKKYSLAVISVIITGIYLSGLVKLWLGI